MVELGVPDMYQFEGKDYGTCILSFMKLDNLIPCIILQYMYLYFEMEPKYPD